MLKQTAMVFQFPMQYFAKLDPSGGVLGAF
jgi:hypothetical protein